MTYHRKLFWAVALFSLLLGAGGPAFGQALQNPKFPANANGRVMASEFQRWALQSQTGFSSSGSQTVTLNSCYIKVGTAYEQFYPIAVNVPLYITDGTNTETVTPTAVTQPSLVTGPSTISPYSCSFTATFANAHANAGFEISSGDSGIEEAINYAIGHGISVVALDPSSNATNTQLTAALVYPQVTIEDLRGPQVQYWNPQYLFALRPRLPLQPASVQPPLVAPARTRFATARQSEPGRTSPFISA